MISLRIHPEGWLFFGIFAAVTFLLFLLNEHLGWIGALLSGWCLYFFRNPERVTPQNESLVISPADGVVHRISNVKAPEELDLGDEEFTRISIFLNVFNVHVNRVPMGGEILKSLYHKGQFLNASLDKASQLNERQTILMESTKGKKIIFTQIAGLIARRILCELSDGDVVAAGQVFGLIRFGSRMDIYLPKGTPVQVIEGQLTVAGETVLADFGSKEATRVGVRS